MSNTATRASAPKSRLLMIVGAATAAIAAQFIVGWEGDERVGYRDIVGVATKCSGDTSNVVVGRRYTAAECADSTDRQLAAHAKPVLACTPGLKGHPNQLAAAISLAYNIGTNGYCGSTVARRFNAGDWSGACDAFLMWNKAGGRVVQGLVNRRRAERDLCRKDLP
ncbi:lysozyme [Sphingomonas sp. PL-96]|uniref:lysozyme n=1 Tax=Sphingomonas sp. PL-96 TaxID=2887201 RepID=UPI001E5D4697|nr:lysozyme [Sphingomonas sp. PL-96]MCC2976250.1 lysozyme [Sphingomonas sp. PL-96]